jgi:hypothetical protein
MPLVKTGLALYEHEKIRKPGLSLFPERPQVLASAFLAGNLSCDHFQVVSLVDCLA